MAKVSRSVLKEIVKECLLEILFEGIDSEAGLYEEEEPIREARQPRRTSRPSSKRSLTAAVEQNRAPKQKKQQRKPPQFKEAAASLTDDPMMQSIFEDTAMTTLQEQKEGARPTGGDQASTIVQETDNLENLFEGAGNWAAIAFNDLDK